MLPQGWAVAFTALFAVTGAHSLWALVGRRDSIRRARAQGHALTDLSHLVMSLAMIAMAWWTPGGPALLLQVVVFTALGLLLLLRALDRSRPPGARHGAAAGAAMNAAMVWMVAGTSVIMPGMPAMAGMPASHPAGGSASTAGAGSTSMAGMVMSSPAGTPAWAGALTWLTVAALGALALWWSMRAVRRERAERSVGHCACCAAMSAGMALILVVMVQGG